MSQTTLDAMPASPPEDVKTTFDQWHTASNANFTELYKALMTQQTLADASTIAWDASLGGRAKFTFVGNSRAMGAPTNLVTGCTYTLELVQVASAYNISSWNAIFAFTGGTAPTLSATNTYVDLLVFYYDGTKLREVSRALHVA